MGKLEQEIEEEAVNKAVECYGMEKILEKRIMRIDNTNKVLAFMGAILPMFMGFISVNTNQISEWDKILELLATTPPLKSAFIIIISLAALIQTLISVRSIACNWNGELPKYRNSLIENHKNAEQYHKIWTRYRNDKEKYAKLLDETNKAHEAQEKIDLTINITNKERRYGKRNALYYYQIKCPICGETPKGIKTNSTCQDCGK